jgi:HPr kinase/phosphorylase
MAAATPTVHASAVLVGAKAALIRGPSGSGKSRLAWSLVMAAREGLLPFARLVADDRTHLECRSGRLLVRPAQALEGRLEIHGVGVRRIDFEPVAVAGIVVDLAAADATRTPEAGTNRITIEGVTLPRLAVAAEIAPLPLVLAALAIPPAGN